MNVIPIVSKQDFDAFEDSLFHLPYPLLKAKSEQLSFDSHKSWKKKQKKSLRSFLSKKRK